MGVPLGLALLAGLTWLIRRRSNVSDGRNGMQVYLDDKKELDVNQKVFDKVSEVAGDCRPLELFEQGIVELQQSHRHPAVEMD